jgi:hypothetical protein
MNNHEKSLINLVSGYGQKHSDKFRKYTSINLDGIRTLVDKPQAVDKSQAQWLISSTLASRTFKEQEQNGSYHLLWADLDKDPKPLCEVSIFIAGLLSNADYEVYASRSAKEDYQKGRVIIPLDQPLNFDDWSICQSILNEKLNSNGFTPDPANLRAAQLCYLPNRGEFYASYSQREGLIFDPLNAWADDIESIRQERKAKTQELETLRKAAKEKREALSIVDLGADCIGSFNKAYSVADVLLRADYAQCGDKFRHPNSESGSFSASVKDGRVHTLSTNDPLYSNGEGAHDAFSAFKVLFADNDLSKALKLAGDEWLTIGEESYNKVKQREYAKKIAEAESQVADLNDNSEPNFKLVSSSTLTADQTNTNWLIKDLITDSSLGLLFGLSGSGKSFLALDMAFCIAAGIDFHGHRVIPGNVVYIAGEGYAGLKKRIKALEIKYGMKAPNLFISRQSASLTDADSAKDVRLAIDSICQDASLVIIDTMHRNFGEGDENSASDFGLFISNIDKYLRQNHETVIVVHHSGHNDTERSRGSSSIRAAMDFEYKVSMSGDVRKGMAHIKLSCTKMKDDEPAEDLFFEVTQQPIEWFDEDGVEINSLILNLTNNKPIIKVKDLTVNQKLALNSLETLIQNEEGVHIDLWRDKFYEGCTAENQEAKKKGFQRVRNELMKMGKIKVKNDFYSFDGELAFKSLAISLIDLNEQGTTGHNGTLTGHCPDGLSVAGQTGTHSYRSVPCPR